tara:strand:- start:2376 stop:2936 length:561 start_codon:yes stop_codon:yes gene_type:complete
VAESLTVARPYARALFEWVRADSVVLDLWGSVLSVLKEAVAQQAFKQQISNPRVTKAELLKNLTGILGHVLEDSVKKIEVELENFISLLIDNKRLQVLSEIFVLYKQLVVQQQKTMNVEVSSAFALSSKLQTELEAILSQRFNTNISAQYKIDSNLIGGMLIRTEAFVVDASIQGMLAQLKNHIIA